MGRERIPVILVVTHGQDLTADLVIRHLLKAKVAYRRLNTEELGTARLHVAFSDGHPELVAGKLIIRSSDVEALWIRRFANPHVLSRIEPPYRKFVARELAVILDVFLEDVRGLQVNPHEVDRISGNRLLQSMHAEKVGFLIPDTMVTQEVGRAERFLCRHNAVVTKAVAFGVLTRSERRAYTSRVHEAVDLAGLEICPALFQVLVPKRRDWRITTVGARVFSTRTRDGMHVDETDWRRSAQIADLFERADLPKDIERMLLALCDRTGLRFGCHDLVETPSGDFYFLETNPAGQWGWLEISLGMPIGEALASLLISGGVESK